VPHHPIKEKIMSVRVYIAGPYTGDEEKNVNEAIAFGEVVANRGFIPFIPHLNHYWDKQYVHDYEFWMNQDLQWLAMCDVLLRMPGQSSGADREVAAAILSGKPVAYSLQELKDMYQKNTFLKK
jgi:hypothetical protein